MPSDFSASENILISFLLTLFITGVFAFSGFAYSTSKLLPDAYYKIKNQAYLKTTYDLLGLRYFRTLLLLVFWGRKNNKEKYFNGTKSGLKNFIFQTKQSEFGHLGAFILIIVVSISLFALGYILLPFIVLLINIIGNLYPIILQRYHRMRIERITKE